VKALTHRAGDRSRRIGEVARVFAAHGFNLVLTARRTERPIALAETGAKLAPSRRMSAPATSLGRRPRRRDRAVDRLGVTIDALVNNAGCAGLIARS
jgi:short-subunit dehydrogenase